LSETGAEPEQAEPLSGDEPNAESDLVGSWEDEVLDLPSWVGVAIGILLVLIALLAILQTA